MIKFTHRLALVVIGMMIGISAQSVAQVVPDINDPAGSTGSQHSVYAETPLSRDQNDPFGNHANAVMAEQTRQTAAAAQTAVNTADIAEVQRMTGTQDFILKLVAIVMPLLIAMMTGVMLYIQIKQKHVGDVRSIEQREDLILVARSVNGMKTELVARSELNAFMEATALADNGKMTRNAEIRMAELQEAVRYATAKAEGVAAQAIQELVEKQAGRASAIKVTPLATGEQVVMEGVDFGEAPLNHDAIPVATGEVKGVVGKPGV